MNIKIIGSIVRWSVLVASTVGAFMGDASFMDAFEKLKNGIASHDIPTIIGSAVAVITLGWSIWDKIKTQNKENEANAQIKSLSETVQIQTAALAKNE